MNTAAEIEGLDKMRIKANDPNWRGGTGIRSRCLQAQIFAGWEAWRGPDGVSDGSWSQLDYLRFLIMV